MEFLKKKFMLLALYSILLWTLVINTAIADSACILTMGWEPWRPYQYLNKKNQLTGLDIELIQAVVINMGCKLKFEKMPWKRLLKQAKDGKVDLVSGATITEERKKWAYFSNPYRTETMGVFVRKNNSSKYPFKSIADITQSKFNLGINSGVYYGSLFKKLMKDPKFKKRIQVVTNYKQNVPKLLLGRIDGFIANVISGVDELRVKNVLDKVELHPMIVSSTTNSVILSKKSVKFEMVDKFNKSLSELKQSGKYEKILNKYLK